MSLTELLKEQVEKRIASWNTQLEAAEAKAKARQAEAEADAAEAELEQELWSSIKDMKQKVSEGQAFLAELAEAGEDKAEQLKARLREFLD